MGIKELYLENFRGFEEYSINFKSETIIVGKNNAGKSSIIEALRLVSFASKRFKTSPYKAVPGWLKDGYKVDLGAKVKGIEANIKGLIKNYDTIFYYYMDKRPAVIKAIFDEKYTIQIYLGSEEKFYATLYDATENNIITKACSYDLLVNDINILPQIGPLALEEPILGEEYVKKSEMLPVTSLHFRNQLKINYELFSQFKDYMEKYLEGVLVTELRNRNGIPEYDKLALLITNERFPAEIGTMGHGFQMWAQIIWFLTKSYDAGTIILDEPDVYLHADLQRKLYNLISNFGKQIIIATHSVEIISAAKPQHILMVDKKRKTGEYISNDSGVKNVLNSIGSTHNTEMAKLFSTNKCVFVEGNDISMLNLFYKKIFPEDINDLKDLPQMPTGGWGGWQEVVGAINFFENNFSSRINSYCIFDRDFRLDTEINERLEKAAKRKVNLHIWSKKEIENYLIVPTAFYRIIRNKTPEITLDLVVKKINTILDENKDDLVYEYSTSIQENCRRLKKEQMPAGVAGKQAKEYVDNYWINFETKLKISAGKTILKQIKYWIQSEYKICFSDTDIIQYLEKKEIDEEVIYVLSKIKNNSPFSMKIPC